MTETYYDKLIGEGGMVTHRQTRQIIAQMEAHGWALTGNAPMYRMTTWAAPDGRELGIQFIDGKKPRMTDPAGRYDRTYKAALALVCTPTHEPVAAPSVHMAAKRIGLHVPHLGESGGRSGEDFTLRPIQDAMRGMIAKGMYGGRGETAAVAAASLRAAAVTYRENAVTADRLYGYGSARDQRSELWEQRAGQFEQIAEGLETTATEYAAYLAEVERRAGLPLDIRPTGRRP